MPILALLPISFNYEKPRLCDTLFKCGITCTFLSLCDGICNAVKLPINTVIIIKHFQKFKHESIKISSPVWSNMKIFLGFLIL